MANYPMVYQPGYGYSGTAQQMYPNYQGQSMMQQPVQQSQQGGPGLIWVDGEIGAKAYQMPGGWPANQPIALWDTNDTCIYLKSINPMGMPNPLQKAHYTLEDAVGREKSSDMSGNNVNEDISQYVRKDDMERMKQELLDAINSVNASSASGVRRTTKGDN